MIKGKQLFYLLLITFLGGFFRFYKLDWGDGQFFHPDEYHIIIAVSKLGPNNLNPHLFSYGSFIVYLIYFTQKLLETISPNINPISPFLIGRFYSALFSTLTIPVVYLISKKLTKKNHLSFLASFAMSLIPGSIQQAHFLTPESTLTFFITTSFYFLLLFLENASIYPLLYCGIALGLASGTKITAVITIPITLIFILSNSKTFLKFITNFVAFASSLFIAFFVSFPYSIFDFTNFVNTISYESSVATGEFPVFYTRSFINSKPVIFQLTKILPFAVGVSIMSLAILGVFLALIVILKNPKYNKNLLALLSYFLLLFIPNSFLYAKWTRFINPAFPFVVILSVFIFYIFNKHQKQMVSEKTKVFFSVFLIFLYLAPTIIWSISFFKIYLKEDVRTKASNWIEANIEKQSIILTESGNTIEVPFSSNFQKIPFDFYALSNTPNDYQLLSSQLANADYFIIQSRRIWANHAKTHFPTIAKFYEKLNSNELGFIKIKTFSSYPGILNFEINDELISEETFTVFDHPVIGVYKNTQYFSEYELESILLN